MKAQEFRELCLCPLKPQGEHYAHFHYRHSERISEVTSMGRTGYTSTNQLSRMPLISVDHHPEVLVLFPSPPLPVSHL